MKTNKPHVTTGYLIFDPELRFTPGGHAVCNLWVGSLDESMQVDPDLKACENWALWREMGERAAETLKRGDLITLTGKPSTHEWADRETGEKKSRITYNATTWITDICLG